MKPPPFAYHRAETTIDALSLLAQHGSDAKLLAGGQSLIPTMNFRLAQPAVLVDLNEISALDYVREEASSLHIGAMTRQRAIEREPLIAQRIPLLHAVMPFIAHPQIRNRGTVGGSLVHADPAAELPAVMLALDARFHILNPHGERWVDARDFYVGLFETTLDAEDILITVAIDERSPRSGWAFDEVARRHGDYALVGVAVTISLDRKGVCDAARIVLLSVGDGPVLADRAVATLVGETITDDVIRAASHAASSDDIDPPGDIHASPAYRRQLARVLTARAIRQALSRVPEPEGG